MSFHEPKKECPVCRQTAELVFLKDHRNQYGDFSLWQCRKCLVRFWLPFENPAARDWYEKIDPYNFKKNDRPRKLHPYHKKFIRRHRQELPQVRILDLGCGTGEFIARLEELHAEAWGTDIDRPAVQIARNNFHLKNVYPLAMEEFFKKDLPAFDYITIFEVLEHVTNPLEILRQAKNFLKSGGKLIISLPSKKRIFPELSKWDYPLHHFSQWSPTAMGKFLSLIGYENVEIRTSGKLHYLYELALQLIIPQKTVDKTKTEIKTDGEKNMKRKLLKLIYPFARLIFVYLLPYLLVGLLFLPTVIFFPQTGSLYVEAEKNK